MGTALSGVAAAEGSGKGETAGRPTVEASAPSCGELSVEYVQGNPPVVVVADGPERVEAQLEPGNRSVTWSVEAGDYEVSATPGEGGSNGYPAVVVDGESVTVDPCEVQEQSVPQTLTVSPTCLPSGYVCYGVTNPTADEVRVDIEVKGEWSYPLSYTIEAGGTFETPELSADGKYTHEFTAARNGGGPSVSVNGEQTWSNTPNCSG